VNIRRLVQEVRESILKRYGGDKICVMSVNGKKAQPQIKRKCATTL